MITIEDFKKFLGWSRPAEDAKKSVGLAILARKNPDPNPGNLVNIPANLIYFAGGQSFQQPINSAIRQINESQNMIEIPLQARRAGSAGNIGANQNWQTDQTVGFSVTNPNPFSLGADKIPQRLGLYPAIGDFRQGMDDTRVQEALDTGKAVVKEIGPIKEGITDEELFNNVLIRQATYLISMYWLENNQVQESSGPAYNLNQTGNQSRRMFKDRTFLPLMQQVDSLISQSGFRDLNYWFDREPA